ncbi:MAG: Sulfurtransferase TusA [Lachnospiraceae bacterium]|nr:Sulfurtransferase TusA [Lachnospiraceae bacterium]
MQYCGRDCGAWGKRDYYFINIIGKFQISVEQFIFKEITVDKKIDARGLQCPMPVIETKKALQGIGIHF